MLGKKLIQAASGSAAAGAGLGVEDVFSTWLYTGNGSTQTITNGIDLAGEGGLVWTKCRSNARSNALVDTIRGGNSALVSDTTNAETVNPYHTFLGDGYTVPTYNNWNALNNTYASWTFRKAPGFFDVVTYTGTGSARTVAHNLGSVPGCIIVKRTDTTADWQVYHRSLANTEYMVLNNTAAKATGTTRWNSTTPTSSVFNLGTDATVNASGGTYVAYLFAHDAGGFGDSGNESVVKCGSFTTDGSGNATVSLGWEPQWILFKPNAVAQWELFDTARGWVNNGTASDDAYLFASTSNAEGLSARGNPTATGFVYTRNASETVIYIAIRRGPMKTPTDATEVFNADFSYGTDTSIQGYLGQVADMNIVNVRAGNANNSFVRARLTGDGYLATSNTAVEATQTVGYWDNMLGFYESSGSLNTGQIQYIFRRAPGFFDVVAYTGTGSPREILHNLGVPPEFIIHKSRTNTAYGWISWHSGLPITSHVKLESSNAAADLSLYPTWWLNSFTPTATKWELGINSPNLTDQKYIAYLFATLPGISKVGSYTGTGTTLDIDCGFTSGARFVLIRRTDSTGSWYVWDTARGIVSGNDPYLLLNSTAAEVTSTDYIDPLSSGFQISSTAPAEINNSGGSYIFLAIA